MGGEIGAHRGDGDVAVEGRLHIRLGRGGTVLRAALDPQIAPARGRPGRLGRKEGIGPPALRRGARAAAQGWRTDAFFSTEPARAPSGRRYLWIKGGPQHSPAAPETDVQAALDGYIAVTPMRADLTAHDRLAELDGLLSGEVAR